MTAHRWLRIYLQDHYGAEQGAVAAFNRVASSHSDPDVATILDGLADAAEQDMRALRDVMRALDCPPAPVKQSAAWMAEKLGRLVTNGRLLRRSPLTDVIELEMLSLAVEVRLRGWRLLLELAPVEPRLDVPALEALVAGAQRQLETLERLRLTVGRKVLSGVDA